MTTSEEELTPDRKIRLHTHLVGLMRSREFQWLQYQQGVLDEATWTSYKNVIPISLGPKRNREWWTAVGHEVYNPAFVEEVNTLLNDRPNPQTWKQVLALK